MTPAASFTLRVILVAIVLALLSTVSAPSPVSQGASQGGAPLDPAIVPAAELADVRPVGAPILLPAAALPSASAHDVSMPAPSPTGEVGSVLIGGTLSYVGAKYGPTYLALPFPRGTVATICGAGGCVTRRSTDFGPDQRVHPNRIADLSAADFVFVCGLPLSAGLCSGTVELEPPVHEADDRMRAEDQPRMTLPPTSTEAQP